MIGLRATISRNHSEGLITRLMKCSRSKPKNCYSQMSDNLRSPVIHNVKISLKTCRLRISSVLLLLTISLLSAYSMADLDSAVSSMEDASNPLMLMKTSKGDIYLELFPAAAPRNTANFIALAEGTAELINPDTGDRVISHYYDGLSFHRVLPGYLIHAGAPLSSGRAVPDYRLVDEINASQSGLNRIKALDDSNKPHPWLNIRDKADFEKRILAPLYRRININDPLQLAERQFEVVKLLREMTLQQVWENQGYVYNNTLPSRRPVRGTLIMASSGPNSISTEFFIPVVDAPWLTGTSTVIGRIVEGIEVVDRIHQESASRLASPLSITTIYEIRQVAGDSVSAPVTARSNTAQLQQRRSL
jgi:cyclophilin family peptidyl-prolyl cis-trans isomerase